MEPLKCSRFVRAPRDKVFAVASDLRAAPGRIPAIVALEVLTEGPVRQGTRFKETRRMFGREATEQMEIVEFDAPRSYTVGAESCGARYRSKLSFEPKDGGTEIVMEFRVEPMTLFAKIMGTLMRPMMKKMFKLCAQDLDGLAAACER